MSKVDVPGDNVMLLTAATMFKRRIRVYPVFKAKYPVINFNPVGGIKPKPGDINLLEYSKDHFTQQFYMSIIQDPNKRKSLPTSESPMESTGHNFSSNESRLSIASGEFSGLFDDSRNTEKQDERSVQSNQSVSDGKYINISNYTISTNKILFFTPATLDKSKTDGDSYYEGDSNEPKSTTGKPKKAKKPEKQLNASHSMTMRSQKHKKKRKASSPPTFKVGKKLNTKRRSK